MPPAAEVFIQATDTDPDVQARAVVAETHRQLLVTLAGLTEPHRELTTAFTEQLRREFEATHPGRFGWEYLVSGAEEWQVRIARVGADV
ncbi:hypothetical protein TPA0910_11250 [Streptomyces hygroscopicus subsp. sporocinereus]|uniref:DUF2249 domain-containing protein n=1 Tax=Streptomyces hygroscopicus TaxID=1912 RepID=A0ABQ3TTP3_STRHY|nr:hypothetical protein [Streptomyces hygroscopicus]GHJ26692.1 hypothetical protein TPA0910_11250 [Streptomyces hygroscopicus]